jgi:hypothetical protein
MWKKILLVALVAGAAATALSMGKRAKSAPATYQVERGAFIAAPPATILSEIARLQNWVGWSRDKDNPAIRRTYGGHSIGAGASYYWFTADHSIEGRMTIISVGTDSVEIEREIVAPNPRLTDYTFKVTPEGAGSRIVWSASGDVDEGFIGNALGGAQEHEKRLASDLEAALAGLKAVVEAQENMHAYRVQRSVLIEAPEVFVLAEIMDFREWNKWFPREQLDPKLKRVFSGTDSQPGSTYYWTGNDRVGAGRVSMISSSADKVDVEVGVEKPIESLSDVVFTFAADGNETFLVCVVSGEKDPSGQAVTLLGSTPELIGAELQQGLAKLKELAEAAVPRGGASRPRAPAPRKKHVLEILADSIVLRRVR